MADNSQHIIELKGIKKHYPGVKALDGVDLKVKPGEVRALVGENGAGKSTLMKMLTGAEALTDGEIIVDNKPVDGMTPAKSEALGIACVYQNCVLAEHLTVAENIWMGRLPTSKGFLNVKKLNSMTEELLDSIGYGGVISPQDRVADLSASQHGMIAIVRALSRDARVVILDEPTAVLAEREAQELFKVVELLKSRGIAIIYISHRMEEIFQICDTITVLKDGVFVGETTTKEATEDTLVTMMVGREVTTDHYDSTRNISDERLTVKNLTNANVRDCSLNVKSGEIVGLYGLVGAGRTELLRAIFGADKIQSGAVLINNKLESLNSPRDAINARIGLVPEDRRRHGVSLGLSVKHNINLTLYRKKSKLGWLDTKSESEESAKYIKSLSIKTPTEDQIVKNLSGGNQQKVVLGKWLAVGAKIFLLDEPTNGIDVGARSDIYELINELAKQGCAFLMASSYMPELMGIADRILVMQNGKLVADVPKADFNEEKLLALAIQDANKEAC